MDIIVFKNIDSLIQNIYSIISQENENIKQACNTLRISNYWTIGRSIQEYINKHRDRSNYGKFLIDKIAEKIPLGRRTLYQALKLYKQYPDKKSLPVNLSWTHLKILISLEPPERRMEYSQKVAKERLSTRELQALIHSNQGDFVTDQRPQLTKNPAVPYSYQVREIQGKPVLDLGFSLYDHSYGKQLSSYSNSTCLQTIKRRWKYRFNPTQITVNSLYTYKAVPLKITDGDTITVDIDLGFNLFTRQKLRLRGINAFEIDSPKGLKAKAFVESALGSLNFIMIKTYKRDKYARFLADIFYSAHLQDMYKIIDSGFFLNQQLLNKELAVEYRG